MRESARDRTFSANGSSTSTTSKIKQLFHASTVKIDDAHKRQESELWYFSDTLFAHFIYGFIQYTYSMSIDDIAQFSKNEKKRRFDDNEKRIEMNRCETHLRKHPFIQYIHIWNYEYKYHTLSEQKSLFSHSILSLSREMRSHEWNENMYSPFVSRKEKERNTYKYIR